ncbi:MAG: J domain-containing protein [Phycisphaerales bacterium]|nr:J domain-containing protein [Phycisphaerales bacterium]
MDPIVVGIAAGLVSGLWALRRVLRNGPAITWAKGAHTSLPPASARDGMIRYFRERQCKLSKGYLDGGVFRRGEMTVKRLRGSEDAHWLRLPTFIAAACWEDGGRTYCHVHYRLSSMVSVSAWGLRYIEECASAEFDGLLRYLDQLSQECERQRQRSRPRHHWYPDDEDAQPAQETPASADPLDADLAVLGLKRGATPEQVTKAYRVACHKYHPDRFNGQNVEPHLVELAVQRFKEVTAAYRRLRDRMGQRA